MGEQPTRVLIVAGSDSGGGAGIQADLKTVTLLGGYGMTAIAAITAQNSRGVQGVHSVPAEMVLAQIESVVTDFGVDAVKIGMIGAPGTAVAVAQRLAALPGVPIVFDPVMVATSGGVLASPQTVHAFERFFEVAALVTPNLPELQALGGLEALASRTKAVLVKGGHRPSEGRIEDRLFVEGRLVRTWSDPWIETPHTHGTGCTLASAIAVGLGAGLSLEDAISRARRFVRLALFDAPDLVPRNGPLGHGRVRNDAMPGPALNQITLPCSDYAASVDFYLALGLTQVVDSPGNSYARFEAPNGVTLSIHGPGSGPSNTVIYFESDRLDAWVAELQTAGIPCEQAPRDQPWGWREARLKDPHGNFLCLFQAGEYRRYPPWRTTGHGVNEAGQATPGFS